MIVAVCGAAVGCQRLEYVSEDEGATAGVDDGIAEDGGAEGDDAEAEDAEAGVPEGPPVCVSKGVCECYGLEGQFCDVVVRVASCEFDDECNELPDDERAACLVGSFCDDGGVLFGDTVMCNDVPAECAGTCDLDPTACDEDGDGVLTFTCGGNDECPFGDYCVYLSTIWTCNDECGDCRDSGGGYACVQPPEDCESDTVVGERECVRREWCEVPSAESHGHNVRCDDDECHV